MTTDAFDHLPDEELAALAHQSMERTRDILAVLYRRHHVALYNFLKRYTGHAHLAEDLLQETFLRVFRSLHRFRPDRRLADWLYTIALNAARDALRSKKPGRIEAVEPSLAAAGTRALDDAELASTLLQRLPDEERAVFLLARVEGRKLQDIADLMEFSLRTAKNRLASAHDRLARELAVMGVS